MKLLRNSRYGLLFLAATGMMACSVEFTSSTSMEVTQAEGSMTLSSMEDTIEVRDLNLFVNGADLGAVRVGDKIECRRVNGTVDILVNGKVRER